MPAFMMMVGMVTSPEAYATASGILMAFMNLGGFVCILHCCAFEDKQCDTLSHFVEMVALFIGALIYLIWSGKSMVLFFGMSLQLKY